MAQAKQFANLSKIKSGVTAGSDLKMSDIFAVQHIDASSGANTLNQVSVAQSMCQPVAISSNTPNDGAYTADCVNFPDFSLTYRDAYGNDQYYFGLKIRVIFENGITYGSVEDGTYPTLNINGSGAVPLLAQGQTMASGAAVAGQTLEFTLIPYGQNSIAWDADSNVRQNTSLATIYSDGNKRLPCVYCESATTTVTGVPLYSGCTVKVMFTAAITGSDTSTAMVINYNGTNITVKVPVNGSLVNYCAKSVSSSYIYCQAYTTLELLYNGTNFIIMGNPVIYSDADSTIYTDGKIAITTVDTVANGNMHSVTSNAVSQELNHYLKKNTFTTFKLLTPGYSRYILIADVSTWYNSTSPNVTQTYTMVGLLLSYRGSGNDRTECAMITLSVGYYRANNPLPANNLMNVKMVGVNGLYYRCCIIRYNNKEYLAIKLLTEQSRYNQFIGYITDTPLYTVLDANTSVTELYVN